ncbi:hypothetical protein HGRIS_012807 [Hohenbuehelia grisea]|uniref:Uncharacterized protein n=1 Tax=Hohenbuehelia grisea TaxID=104357 RepID=A0ABR3ITE8_9AGAR
MRPVTVPALGRFASLYPRTPVANNYIPARTKRRQDITRKSKKKHSQTTNRLGSSNLDIASHPGNKFGTNDSQHRILAGSQKTKEDLDTSGMAAVPVPIPDTGSQSAISPSIAHRPFNTSPAHASSATAHSNTLANSLVTTSTPTTLSLPASALPSSLSFSVTQARSSPSASSGYPLSVFPVHTALAQSHSTQHTRPLLSTLAIALIAGGSACFLLGAFIIIKACTRPQRRPRPTPSLPILESGFGDNEKAVGDESPIFGGKERLSPQINHNSRSWIWPQEPQAAQMWPESVQAPSHLQHWEEIGIGHQSQQNVRQAEKQRFDFIFTDQHGAGPTLAHPSPINLAQKPPIQQMQHAITRAARRLSTASLRLYPNEYHTSNVGDGPTLTADGHGIMSRGNAKAALRKSKSVSVLKQEERTRGISYHWHSQGLAYDGADVYSPNIQSMSPAPIAIAAPTPSAKGGRSRIKSSYYTSVAYPRTSAVPQGLTGSVSAKSFVFDQTSGPALQRSESRRDRDTQALAAALGFGSPSPICPPPPSPQPTLYPDDSLSMAGPPKRTLKKRMSTRGMTADADRLQKTASLAFSSPPLDAGSALGNLMLMDFATSKSIATLGARLGSSQGGNSTYVGSGAATMTMANKAGHSRAGDKPPRVPSPPPLPSLAQMALEHADPNGYADYRSPTYSIYGLYEADRKSRLSAAGNER